jgi:putative serine protease PepD
VSDTPIDSSEEIGSNTTPAMPDAHNDATPLLDRSGLAAESTMASWSSPPQGIGDETLSTNDNDHYPKPPASAPRADETPAVTSRGKSRGLWSTRVSLLLVAALVGGLAGHFASPASSGTSGLSVNVVGAAPGAALLPNGMSIPKLVVKVLPSIVSIDVIGQGSEDQGTGMIITKGGLVLTNNHVIAAAVGGGTITVTRSGSTKSEPATLVGTNPIDDVALIRINGAKGLPAVTFGNSNALVAGDAVVAIGNALGLAAGTPTVTQGIVSALGRTVTAGTSTASETLNNMIQTDAAINPGNSGGPLLDSSGDVIGMNTAVAGTLADGETTQNIGFAIPVATIESLLTSLKAGESVVNHGAFIGVEIESMTPSLQAQYGFSVSSGAVITSIISGTGAAAAGLQQGDIIVGINKTTISGAQDVSSVISSLRPGDQITMRIVRGTKHLSIKVTLGHEPAS